MWGGRGWALRLFGPWGCLWLAQSSALTWTFSEGSGFCGIEGGGLLVATPSGPGPPPPSLAQI